MVDHARPSRAVARAAAWALLGTCSGWGAGCQEAPSGPAGGVGLRLAALSPGCVPNENEDHALPTGADRVVVRLSGGAIPAATPLVASFASGDETTSGQIVVPNVPPGTGMTVEVVACAGTGPTWEGTTSGVTVTTHTKSFPSVFLTPVGKVACTGTAESAPSEREMQSGHAFAAVHAYGDQAYVLGGLANYDSGTRLGTASTAVDIYDRVTGTFAAGTPLSEARAGAYSDLDASGRARLVGGAVSIALGKAGKPSLWAEPVAAPTCAVAEYDLGTGATTCLAQEVWPALPSVAATTGSVVAVGGIVEDGGNATGASSARVLGASGASSEVALPGPSFGATVVGLDGDRVLAWGGAWDGELSKVGVLLDLASGTAQAVAQTGATDIPIFATGQYLGQESGVDYVLIAGGATLTKAAEAGQTITAARLAIVALTVATSTAVFTPLDPGTGGAFARAAATLQTLETGSLWWLGGTKAFFCQSETECLPAEIPGFTVAEDGTLGFGTPVLSQSVGGLGLGSARLSDGAWLLTAGLETTTQAGAVQFRVGTRAELVRHSAAAGALCSSTTN